MIVRITIRIIIRMIIRIILLIDCIRRSPAAAVAALNGSVAVRLLQAEVG